MLATGIVQKKRPLRHADLQVHAGYLLSAIINIIIIIIL